LVGATVATIVVGLTIARVDGLALAMRGGAALHFTRRTLG
jgi:hypothetical protein